ncbi:MAG: helix-turn-helix transcriptional regulator [Anaerolineales bacterium]|uniref:helix-turn-helix domain-containing protein n=1 Tax=Promineifilum sp. TaxID=2664178 RepID=UPI001E0EA833|nr:helix-turn-helix transcriptional regulator [Anaerolineales bacterium]MCO5179609.1 helix-turn-helix domain-containing protein [Promineifilum sp.]
MSTKRSRPSISRFGEKLRTLRLQQGMTLQQFAESLGYSAHGYLSELETGKKSPSVELVINISRIYHVTTDELLKDELELGYPAAKR